MRMRTKVLFPSKLIKGVAHTHTSTYKANNIDAWGYVRDNCVEKLFQSDY